MRGGVYRSPSTRLGDGSDGTHAERRRTTVTWPGAYPRRYGTAMRHTATVRTLPLDAPASVVARTLQHVTEHALDATVMMTADGRITGWNVRAEALFGWSAAEVVGQPLVNIIV